MKVLLLSAALLFFTGVHGRHFWQQDAPNQESEAEEKTLQKIVHDSIAIITDVVKHLDYSKIAEQHQIEERLKVAQKTAKKLEKALESYYDDIYKKFSAELHEKFPVFSEKVVPMIKEFDDALEEQFKKLVKDAVPVGSDLVSGISKHFISFFENLGGIAEKGRDRFRAEIDSLRVKVQPYVDDVHAEYEKYRKNMQEELEKDYKGLKQEVEKNVEQIKEQAKPHIENMKEKLPDAKELQEQLEKFLQKVKEVFENIE